MADERRGFSGFDSLVSDLSDLPVSPPPSANEEKTPAAAPDSAPSPAAAPTSSDDDGPDWVPPPEPKRMPTKLIMAGLVVGGLIVVGMVSDNNKKSRSASPSYPQATYTPPPATYTPTPSTDIEEKPPIGEGIVLSTAQLRYCLSQNARIDGADKAVNLSVKVEVDRFNGMVDDYNSRCGKTRYRSSTMQSVKADVEGRRAQLEKEGAGLIRSTALR